MVLSTSIETYDCKCLRFQTTAEGPALALFRYLTSLSYHSNIQIFKELADRARESHRTRIAHLFTGSEITVTANEETAQERTKE